MHLEIIKKELTKLLKFTVIIMYDFNITDMHNILMNKKYSLSFLQKANILIFFLISSPGNLMEAFYSRIMKAVWM